MVVGIGIDIGNKCGTMKKKEIKNSKKSDRILSLLIIIF